MTSIFIELYVDVYITMLLKLVTWCYNGV